MALTKASFTIEQAEEIGDRLKVDWKKIDLDQFRRGLDVVLEHGKKYPSTNVTDDKSMLTGKIALAHLNELPDYYDRLEILESENFWERVEGK